MQIVIAGGTGFIGRKLAQALHHRGHHVRITTRSGHGGSVAVDYAAGVDVDALAKELQGADAVVNAIGIIREHGDQTFARIHDQGPRALFAAAVAAGVPRLIQVSALGAERGTSDYFKSKKSADDFLLTLPLDWTIVRPALVYGPGGTSAALFNMMASLPVIPLPGDGKQQVQPVHVDDLIEAIVRMIEGPAAVRECVEMTGPAPASFREYLQMLRSALGLGKARDLPIPHVLMSAAASIGSLSSRSLMDRQTLQMLEAGNVGDPEPLRRILGREARGPASFVNADEAANARLRAQLSWLLPLLRYSMAAVWIWTGIVSLGLYSTEESYVLLARVGVEGTLATLLLYGAAVLDLLLGLAIVFMHRRSAVWLAQIAVMLTFTVIISIWLPDYWLHPYGPILKNLPMLAGVVLLYVLEPEAEWDT